MLVRLKYSIVAVLIQSVIMFVFIMPLKERTIMDLAEFFYGSIIFIFLFVFFAPEGIKFILFLKNKIGRLVIK